MNKRFFLILVISVLLANIGIDAIVDMAFRTQIQWFSNITFSIISTAIFAFIGYKVFFSKPSQKTDDATTN